MPYRINGAGRYYIKKSSESMVNWSKYNKALTKRGEITLWLSEDVIANWIEKDRVYDGTGTPNLYSDMAILTLHEIRQVFNLPLRQCEGFVNSLLKLMKLDLCSPCFSALSKRLKKLNLKRPFYRKGHYQSEEVVAIAIDSSGLKCYGQDEWHQEKYGLRQKKSWRKLHITVDNHHIIQSSELTDHLVQDASVVDKLIHSIDERIKHATADAAYDTDSTYQRLTEQFPSADIVISPQKNAVYDENHTFYRNRNVLEIHCYGRQAWQKRRSYGQRNYSELAIQRYKRLLGNKLHARELTRQKQEALIGCSILNKMMCLTMAQDDQRCQNT